MNGKAIGGEYQKVRETVFGSDKEVSAILVSEARRELRADVRSVLKGQGLGLDARPSEKTEDNGKGKARKARKGAQAPVSAPEATASA